MLQSNWTRTTRAKGTSKRSALLFSEAKDAEMAFDIPQKRCLESGTWKWVMTMLKGDGIRQNQEIDGHSHPVLCCFQHGRKAGKIRHLSQLCNESMKNQVVPAGQSRASSSWSLAQAKLSSLSSGSTGPWKPVLGA